MYASVRSRSAPALRPGLSNATAVPFVGRPDCGSSKRTAVRLIPYRPAFPILGSYCKETQPTPVSALALELFSEHLLQHVLVKGQVSYQRFQFLVLVFQLAQPRQLRYPHARHSALPLVESLFRDPRLATDFCHRHAAFCLPHRVEHLLSRKVLPHPASFVQGTASQSRKY